MSESRRQFLANGSLSLLGIAVTSCKQEQKAAPLPPGAPPAFATAPAVGPEVSPLTFAEAEKLVQVELSDGERKEAVESWRSGMAPLYERRTGPRKVPLEATLAPWSHCEATLPGQQSGPARNLFLRSKSDPGPLPASDEDIAFAPVTRLSRWIETRKLTSERLTNIYLARIERFNPTLLCVITPTRELALAQAKQADQEIAAGHYRGPLHGIPWGGKDLLDTAGIPTTYGAEPFRNRVPTEDATVVKRLHEAGAVLVAKLSMGALALNDVWFGGQTKNPWLLAEGSSGSSAGPGAATAAGTGGLCHRQRDRRQHHRPKHALRDYRPAPDLWPGSPHRRHDALLVARQAGPDDAQCGRRHAGAGGDQRAGCGRCVERAQQAGLRRGREGRGSARGLLSAMDERGTGHRRRSRGARNGEEAGHGPG